MAQDGLSEDLYTEIQQIFRETPAVLVGSGFSCGYGLPGMRELGTHLINTIEGRLASSEAKALWLQSLEAIRVNLEAGLNTIPHGAAGREEIITAIRDETATLILRETAVAESSVLGHSNPQSHAPVRLLRRLFDGSPQNAEGIPVVTTNYDTLLELFCDLAELPLDTGFTGFRRRKPRSAPIFQTQYSRIWAHERRSVQADHRPCKTVRLHKPHGSISWLETAEGPVEVLNDNTHAARAIVIPGPSKYQDALVNVLFDTMRTAMNDVITDASALLCLGFGFNDDHLQGVIKARLDACMPLILLTRGCTGSIEKILQAYPHVIAFFRQDTGSVCHWRGRAVATAEPLWQLDDFLKTFLE